MQARAWGSTRTKNDGSPKYSHVSPQPYKLQPNYGRPQNYRYRFINESPQKPLQEILLRPPAVDAGVGDAAEREHLPYCNPVRPDVRVGGECEIADGLGRHPLERQRRVRLLLVDVEVAVHVLGEAKVGDLGPAVLRDEDVPAGEVHVDDALAGEVLHAPGRVDGPRQQVAEGEGLLVEAVVGEYDGRGGLRPVSGGGRGRRSGC